MLTYGLESAAIAPQDHRALLHFQAQSLRSILRIKSTYYTEVLNPTATTFTHIQVIQQAKMPTITAIIHKSQLKFLGHILRTNYHSNPVPLEGDIVFSKAFVYRGGVIGSSNSCRRGKPRLHWLDQATSVAWDVLSQENHRITWNAKDIPYLYLQLRQLAQDRVYWGHITSVPTHIADSQEQHTVTYFSQAPEDS